MIFIKIEEAPSESDVKDHEEEIVATSLQFGVGRAISEITSGRTARTVSNPSFSEVTFTCIYDSSGPYLQQLATNGKALGEVLITFLKDVDQDTKVDYLVITLTNVYISSFSFSSGGDEGMVSCSMTFDKVELNYKALDESHGTEAEHPYSYDLRTTGS